MEHIIAPIYMHLEMSSKCIQYKCRFDSARVNEALECLHHTGGATETEVL